MCNLSSGIEARGEARGESRGAVKGEAKGIIQTAQDFGASEAEIISKIQEKMHVTLTQAQEYFGMYGKKTM